MANVATLLPSNTLIDNMKHHTYESIKLGELKAERNDYNAVAKNKANYKMEIVWFNVALLSLIHVVGLYGSYIVIAERRILTFLFLYVHGMIAGVGITAGSHRLWSHKAYSARLPLRIALMLMQSMALQTPIYYWVRDHRVHHKYTDTDADPHNSKRGFFFSHVGWLMLRKHPAVTRCGQGIDMSDIRNDPVVAFQLKYYWALGSLLAFIMPTLIPMYFWNESFRVAVLVTIAKYAFNLNFTWLVNSAAHMLGTRPYDTRISPTENLTVSILAYGEGWHNYHHVYPWDYKAAELGSYGFNFSTAFIDFFAWVGLAYDLKYATPDMIRRHVKKYGAGHSVEAKMPSDD